MFDPRHRNVPIFLAGTQAGLKHVKEALVIVFSCLCNTKCTTRTSQGGQAYFGLQFEVTVCHDDRSQKQLVTL